MRFEWTKTEDGPEGVCGRFKTDVRKSGRHDLWYWRVRDGREFLFGGFTGSAQAAKRRADEELQLYTRFITANEYSA